MVAGQWIVVTQLEGGTGQDGNIHRCKLGKVG